MDGYQNNITYRRATIDDIDLLVGFRIRFLKERYQHPEDEETIILKSSLHDYFTKTLSNDEYIGIIAERNGKILGTGGMVLWRIPPRYGAHISGRRGYIVNMYTIPKERKHGIGNRIVQELVKHARSLGLAYLHLHASKNGIGVYQKAGFSATEQVELDLTVE